MNIAKQVAEILLNIKAVKVKVDPPFTWTSGIKSPVYCDNRRLISHPEGRKIIVDAFDRIIKENQMAPEVIGGTATAAIPWAAFLAYQMNLPMIYIRPEKKEHGAGKQIEGDLEPGKKVLIVEDLISTGGSLIKSAKAVREEGKCKVTDVIAIMTWEFEKADDAFKKARLNLTTLTDFTNLIGLAVERGDIKQDEFEKILEFKKGPALWWDKMGY